MANTDDGGRGVHRVDCGHALHLRDVRGSFGLDKVSQPFSGYVDRHISLQIRGKSGLHGVELIFRVSCEVRLKVVVREAVGILQRLRPELFQCRCRKQCHFKSKLVNRTERVSTTNHENFKNTEIEQSSKEEKKHMKGGKGHPRHKIFITTAHVRGKEEKTFSPSIGKGRFIERKKSERLVTETVTLKPLSSTVCHVTNDLFCCWTPLPVLGSDDAVVLFRLPTQRCLCFRYDDALYPPCFRHTVRHRDRFVVVVVVCLFSRRFHQSSIDGSNDEKKVTRTRTKKPPPRPSEPASSLSRYFTCCRRRENQPNSAQMIRKRRMRPKMRATASTASIVIVCLRCVR